MRLYILLAAASLAAGCAAPLLVVDGNFGRAVNGAKAGQVIDPDAPSRRRSPAVTDGQAAKSAVDRYQKSFESPPPPINVLNIGIGSGGSSASQ